MAAAALHHVTIHGHDVTYRMGGDGPAVLLIHDFMATTEPGATNQRAFQGLLRSRAEGPARVA
jgi:hypothetical protein